MLDPEIRQIQRDIGLLATVLHFLAARSSDRFVMEGASLRSMAQALEDLIRREADRAAQED